MSPKLDKDMLIRAELADYIGDGYWEWDLINPEFEYMSPKFWQTLGYRPATQPHHPDAWRDKIHPEDCKRAVADFHAHIGEDQKPYKLLVRYRHAKGHWVWILCRGQALYDPDGIAIKMIGSHQDVTSIVRANLGDLTDLRESSDGALRSMEKILDVLGAV